MLASTEMRHSPRDTACKFCGKLFTRKGCAEHMRHACKKNPKRRKRSFGKVKCLHCGKEIYETGLRVHVATQHPEAYAHSPSVKAHRARAHSYLRGHSPRPSPEGARREPQAVRISGKTSEAAEGRSVKNDQIWRAARIHAQTAERKKAHSIHKS